MSVAVVIGRPSTCSGAAFSGVNIRSCSRVTGSVCDRLSGASNFAMPKSSNFAVPSPVTKMFAALMSR